MTFENTRVWFITGTSSGFGKCFVEAILASGERVVATLRKPEVLAYLKDKYTPEQLLILQLDVVNDGQIEAAFAATKEHFGRLDVVVNNAGYGLFGEAEGVPLDEAREQVEVLFWGPVKITLKAVKFFRENSPADRNKYIFNVSSAGGYNAVPCLAFYSAGKFALEGFTESLSKELLPSWNIKASIIQPGGFDTRWKGDLRQHPQPPAYATPDAPTSQWRAFHETGVAGTGSPEKAAAALIKLSHVPVKELPTRIQFGSDAWAIVKGRAEATVRDAVKWGEISHSTNNDGADKETIIQSMASLV
ncbi:NAD(P)-binding protein [Thelephora ganbajun]|uniref:NAD(P)-binding protein n=1 Tax=Thelephora ganbajun TaxID=370292 RepID=A0ACB6ZW04_THEGA|nr:NAD(P)-binding protein [Thelephora ganbajun]